MKLLGWLVPWWAWAIAGALILSVTFGAGFKVASWRCEAGKTAALERAQKQFDKQLAEANERAADYERNRARGQAESRQRETRVREIYRDKIVPGECEPSPDALRVLDDALDAARSNTG